MRVIEGDGGGAEDKKIVGDRGYVIYSNKGDMGDGGNAG